MYTFLFWMVHCGIWNRCILGFFSIFKSPLSAVLGQTSYRPKCIRLTSLYRQLLLVLISADIVLPMIYMCANNMLQCNPGSILWLCPANERWRYIVTSSLSHLSLAGHIRKMIPVTSWLRDNDRLVVFNGCTWQFHWYAGLLTSVELAQWMNHALQVFY